MNLLAFVRDLARSEGIPEPLIPSVEHRAHMAKRAVRVVSGYEVLGGGLEVLGRRIVSRAVSDHRVGVLERRA